MNILNSPSGNLYKVFAVSLLTLIVGLFVFVALSNDSISAQVLSFDIQKAAFEVDKNYIVEDIEKLESEEGKSSFEVSKLRKFKWDWEKRNAQMSVRSQYYSALKNRNHGMKIVIGWLVGFLFLIFSLTLFFWYQCLQKHLDEFARNGVNFLSQTHG